MWECLENIDGLAGVPALWQAWLGGNFAGFNRAFLRKRPGRAKSYPCPRECGCAHEIVTRRDGSLVAVCRCEPWNCDDFTLTAAEAVVLELNWSRLGRSLCGALQCDVRDTDLGVSKARQIGSFSSAPLPIVLSLQSGRASFGGGVNGLIARLGKPFVILAATSRFMDGAAVAVLNAAKAGFFDLESHFVLLPSGVVQARKTAGELFSPLLPGTAGPVPEEVARELSGLVRALSLEQGGQKAPALSVFQFYIVDGLSRAEAAKRCGCVPGLITLRLKQIEEKLGRKRAELRLMSSHFQQIEDSLSHPGARRIDRKRAIYGDAPPDGQED